MLVHAFVTAFGTLPEPAVFPVFDRFDKELADFVGSGFRVAVLAHYYLPKFLWNGY